MATAAFQEALHSISRHVGNASASPLAKYVASVLAPAVKEGVTPAAAHVRTATNLDLFLTHQTTHAELIARYNPTLSADEEERVRLTARRVGLDVPREQKA